MQFIKNQKKIKFVTNFKLNVVANLRTGIIGKFQENNDIKNVFSDEYVTELCEGNEIYFLENGTEYHKIEKLLNGLI